MRQREAGRRIAAGAAVLSALTALGCEGGVHRRGERQILLLGSYGEPIGGEAVWPDGDGTAQNAGLTLGYNHFLRDRVSWMGTLTPYRIYNQDDGDIYAGEFQLGLRYYFWEFDLAQVPVSLYGEILGGLTYGARSIPEEGSNFNFTQDTGLGFEMKLTDHISWTSGYRLKHLSNGNLFNDDNPSQNDHHVYTGIAFTFE